MNMLELSEEAREHYYNILPRNLVNGFEKILLTDGRRFIFVNHPEKINLAKGEALFRIRTISGTALVEEIRNNI